MKSYVGILRSKNDDFVELTQVHQEVVHKRPFGDLNTSKETMVADLFFSFSYQRYEKFSPSTLFPGPSSSKPLTFLVPIQVLTDDTIDCEVGRDQPIVLLWLAPALPCIRSSYEYINYATMVHRDTMPKHLPALSYWPTCEYRSGSEGDCSGRQEHRWDQPWRLKWRDGSMAMHFELAAQWNTRDEEAVMERWFWMCVKVALWKSQQWWLSVCFVWQVWKPSELLPIVGQCG